MASMADFTTQHDTDSSRYVAMLDGEQIGEAAYSDTAEGRVFTHTEISPQHGGQGYGTRLVRAALDDTREAGLTPIGQCSMVQAFLDKHPEYARPAAV